MLPKIVVALMFVLCLGLAGCEPVVMYSPTAGVAPGVAYGDWTGYESDGPYIGPSYYGPWYGGYGYGAPYRYRTFHGSRIFYGRPSYGGGPGRYIAPSHGGSSYRSPPPGGRRR